MLSTFLRRSGTIAAAFAVTVSLLGACSGDDIALGSEDDSAAPADASGVDTLNADAAADAADALPACTLPAALDVVDADPSTPFSTGRTILECRHNGGLIETCPTDDPTKCPASYGVFEEGTYYCVQQCADDEYGLQWGASLVSGLVPPSGCHSIVGGGFVPSGTLYCCPCGT